MYRLRKKCGMPFLGTFLNCLTPAVAPELPQFLSPHLQKEKLRPGEQGWPGPAGGRGGRPLGSETGFLHRSLRRAPSHFLRVAVAFWEMLSTGKMAFLMKCQ